jgi:hypothetical protein
MENIKNVVVLIAIVVLLVLGWNLRLHLPEARINEPVKVFSKEMPLNKIATVVETPGFVDGAINGTVIWGRIVSSFLQNAWQGFWGTIDEYWRTEGKGIVLSSLYIGTVLLIGLVLLIIAHFLGFFVLLWACVAIHATFYYYAGLFLACTFWLGFFYVISRDKGTQSGAGEDKPAAAQSLSP